MSVDDIEFGNEGAFGDAPAALREDLTGFQRDILFVIAREGGLPDDDERFAPSGSELRSALADAYNASGGDEVNKSRTYQNLDEVFQKGLIKKGEHNGRMNYYTLTEEGWTICAQQMRFETGVYEP